MMDGRGPTARIIAAFERLQADDYPIPEGTIPYRHSIPMIARQLTIMRRVDTDTRPARTAHDDLAKLVKSAKHLRNQLEQWTDHRNGMVVSELMMCSIETARATFAVLGSLSSFVEVAERERKPDAGMKGRPRKSAPDEIVAFLYQEYERITGKYPTLIVRGGKAGGEFLTLVREVFKALGLKDSPEATVRRVMAKKTAAKSKTIHTTT